MTSDKQSGRDNTREEIERGEVLDRFTSGAIIALTVDGAPYRERQFWEIEVPPEVGSVFSAFEHTPGQARVKASSEGEMTSSKIKRIEVVAPNTITIKTQNTLYRATLVEASDMDPREVNALVRRLLNRP